MQTRYQRHAVFWFSLPLHQGKVSSQKSQAKAHLQIASAFPLATGLKELFSIGLWGEGINVNQSR